jgi:hypothetical protein
MRRKDGGAVLSLITFGSLGEWIRQAGRPWRLPILVPVYNNPTYARSMVAQLAPRGLEVVVIDNASDAAPMAACLDELADQATVVRLNHNFGPFIFRDEAAYDLLPDLFCLTDPDLALHPELPADFLDQLAALTEKFRIGKAGFALDISEPHLLKDERFAVPVGHATCWEYEAQYWTNPLGATDDGDPVYRADIDTTFALYNKKYFTPNNHYPAVRVAGRYTAKHLPWYKDSFLPIDEDMAYRASQKYSTYSPPNVGIRTNVAFEHYIGSVFDQIKPRSVCEVGPGLGRYGRLAKKSAQEHGYEVDAVAVDAAMDADRRRHLSDIYDSLLEEDAGFLIDQDDREFDLVILNGVLPALRKSEGVDLLHAMACRSAYVAVILPEAPLAKPQGSGAPDRSSWREDDFAAWPSIRHAAGGVGLFLLKGAAPPRA